MEGGSLDAGNARFAGQEAMVVFDDVFVPNGLIFMDGETDYAAMLVQRFTTYHRRSYVCKTGVGDVLIGAAGQIADMNGVATASHIKDKLVEMTHLNETIYGTGIAASYQGTATASGAYICDEVLANVCKHHVTRLPYEIGRLAQDLGGGLVVTLPSEKDLDHPEVGQLLRKYLKGRDGFTAEERMRVLRLIENMTLGRNAVGYLTESMHGAGSPQAQRIEIGRAMQLEYKKRLARALAGIETAADREAVVEEMSGYFARVFALPVQEPPK
jgi:4-hydroxybutyryl-CoA dehydratase/vinylacetyl-CoA-Delta-isomerase